MKLKTILTVLASALMSTIMLTDSAYAGQTTVTIAVGSVGTELKASEIQAQNYMKAHPDVTVRIVPIPASTTEKISYFLQLMEAKSSEVDIYTVDIAWLGDIGGGLTDLKQYGAEDTVKKMFPNVAQAGYMDGKLLGLPWFVDAGMLYYRTDLLKKYNLDVPKTWTDLAKAAYTIQEGEKAAGNKDFVGYVWQGACYEGLTCDAIEWLASNDGGTIVSNDKKVTLNNPNAIKAVTMAASWIGMISPKGVLSMQEEESRAVFQSGNAAFMRNWPYAYVLSNGGDSKVKGKFDVAPMPAGDPGKSANCLGGWMLSVSKYSKNPKAATDVATFMCSEESQKIRALVAGQSPTIMSLYKDEEILKSNPMYKSFYDVLMNTVIRPSTVTAPNYNQVSQKFYKNLYAVLSGQSNAESAMKDAADAISKITGFPSGTP